MDHSNGNKFENKSKDTTENKIKELEEPNKQLDYDIKLEDSKPLNIKNKYSKDRTPKLYDNEIENIINYNKINYLKY